TSCIISDRTARRLAQLGASGFAELSGVTIQAVDRVDVHHLRMNDLHLRTHFESVPAQNARIVYFGIPRRRILELWIRRLPSQAGKTGDVLGVQTACQLGKRRQARYSIKILHAGATEARRLLAGHNVGEPEAEFQE